MNFPTINHNHAAFATATVLAGATVISAIGATTAVSTVSTVALAILAVTTAAISIASITAWVKTRDSAHPTVNEYFENVRNHAGHAIVGMYQLVAQTLVQAVIQGIANGLSTAVRRKIAGPDVTIQSTGQ